MVVLHTNLKFKSPSRFCQKRLRNGSAQRATRDRRTLIHSGHGVLCSSVIVCLSRLSTSSRYSAVLSRSSVFGTTIQTTIQCIFAISQVHRRKITFLSLPTAFPIQPGPGRAKMCDTQNLPVSEFQRGRWPAAFVGQFSKNTEIEYVFFWQ